jgi:hypothetical protein
MSLLKKYAKTGAPSTPTPAPVQEVAAPVEQVAVSAPAPKAFGVRKPPAPTPAPVVEKAVEAQVVPDKPKAATNAVTSYNPMSLLDGSASDMTESVLNFALAKSEEKGPSDFDGPFPLVKLSKGNSGGTWQFGGNVEGEAAMVMPVAKKNSTAIFLGVRIYGLAWPEGYVDKGDTKGDAKGATAKPLWQVKIGSGDKANFEGAIRAGEVYQYTAGAKKAESFDGLGHFRPGVEFLLMREGVIFVVRLPDHYTSTIRALAALGTVMNGLGGMRAAPITIEPYTTEEPGKTPWKCHSLRITFAASADGKKQADDFQAIKADLMADPEFQKLYAEWNSTDATPEALAAMHDIADMGK